MWRPGTRTSTIGSRARPKWTKRRSGLNDLAAVDPMSRAKSTSRVNELRVASSTNVSATDITLAPPCTTHIENLKLSWKLSWLHSVLVVSPHDRSEHFRSDSFILINFNKFSMERIFFYVYNLIPSLTILANEIRQQRLMWNHAEPLSG